MIDRSPADALDLLPQTIRNHPSVIPGAIAKRVQVLYDLGWAEAEVRKQMVGVETAATPGAAILTRLDALARRDPSSPPVPHPRWCGQCDQRTRMREDQLRDNRPYRCPECHPRTTRAA